MSAVQVLAKQNWGHAEQFRLHAKLVNICTSSEEFCPDICCLPQMFCKVSGSQQRGSLHFRKVFNISQGKTLSSQINSSVPFIYRIYCSIPLTRRIIANYLLLTHTMYYHKSAKWTLAVCWHLYTPSTLSRSRALLHTARPPRISIPSFLHITYS